jgi:hypothetical protein
MLLQESISQIAETDVDRPSCSILPYNTDYVWFQDIFL